MVRGEEGRGDRAEEEEGKEGGMEGWKGKALICVV